MNRIQKAATAFVALSVTLVGATLVTAPLLLVDIRPAALQQATSSVAQRIVPMAAQGLRQG